MNTISVTFWPVAPQDSKLNQSAAKIWAQAAAHRDHKPTPADGRLALPGVQRRLALPGARLVIGFVSAEPAGFSLCAPHDDYLEIYYVAVAPDFWGCGIARELLTEVDRHASDAGYTDLRLWVIADNARAIDLYRACGYVDTGQEVVDDASDRIERLLHKRLDPTAH